MQKAIIKTLAFFDIYDYPLTATEVWRWLYRPPRAGDGYPTLGQVSDALANDPWLTSRITRVEGFYCFRGREEIVAERKRRNLAMEKQMRKAVGITRLFRLIPYVRLVAISSSLAIGNVKESSDIDLFIVCEPQTIWFTRFLLVGILELLGERPSPENKKDKICLSYYVTERALSLSGSAIGPDDPLMHYHVATLMPLYDADNVYAKFIAENRWNENNLPLCSGGQATVRQLTNPGWLRFVRTIGGLVLGIVFNRFTRDWYCRWQLEIMPSRLKTLANVDTRVIISDNVLKFHDQDIRGQLRQRWLDRIHTYEQ